MSRNLVKTSVNLTQPTNYQFIASNSTAERIWKSFAYCLFFVVSLAGNCFIGAIVYKEKPIRKTINFSGYGYVRSDPSNFRAPTDANRITRRLLACQWSSWSDSMQARLSIRICLGGCFRSNNGSDFS